MESERGGGVNVEGGVRRIGGDGNLNKKPGAEGREGGDGGGALVCKSGVRVVGWGRGENWNEKVNVTCEH